MRRRVKNNCGCEMKHKLPDIPSLDLCLYHWSPTTNRPGIKRVGLLPGRKTLQGDWRPPYVCFSDDPILAWSLSGDMWPETLAWDLWLVHMPSQTSFDGYEIILDTYRDSGRHFVKEYRIYSRVYKRDLYYVASRTSDLTRGSSYDSIELMQRGIDE